VKNSSEKAFLKLVERLKSHYGSRLSAIYRVDERKIWDAEEQADVEIAVVLTDGDWRFADEHQSLVALAFESVLDDAVYVRAWPISERGWIDPSASSHPSLVRDLKVNAQPVRESAA
jgi:hypothetical protein